MKNICFVLCWMFVTVFGVALGLVPTDADLFENKNILILGGTGYIGRAITSEVLKYNPQSVTIFYTDPCELDSSN